MLNMKIISDPMFMSMWPYAQVHGPCTCLIQLVSQAGCCCGCGTDRTTGSNSSRTGGGTDVQYSTLQAHM
jgi:hypothetical protein